MHALLVANPSFFCFGRLYSRPALLQSPNASPLLSFRNPQGIRRMRLATKMPARCSMDVALGGSFNYENVPKFPRMNQWDPYKLLGVTPDASGEEIRGARNFLVEQYAGHERSVESIEAAYDKILMKSFRERKKSKINLKSSLKKKVEESPPWVKTLVAYVELPPMDVILKRLFLFIFMAIWSITQSAEAGPAFQVLLSLASCIYFLNDKMKSLPRATISGFATLVMGWIAGSVLVPMIPSSLVQPSWTLELLISLVCYIFFFLSCTFLK